MPVSDVAQLSTGMPAQVEIEGIAGRKFAGRVERINPSTEPGTRTINIYVSLPNEDSLLRAGMFARVALVTSAEAEVPALPISALRVDNGTTFVWTVVDGKLVRRLVEVGRRDERAQMVEVTGGLTANDTVIATKFDNLKDGLAAKVIGGIGRGARRRPGRAGQPAARQLGAAPCG